MGDRSDIYSVFKVVLVWRGRVVRRILIGGEDNESILDEVAAH